EREGGGERERERERERGVERGRERERETFIRGKLNDILHEQMWTEASTHTHTHTHTHTPCLTNRAGAHGLSAASRWQSLYHSDHISVTLRGKHRKHHAFI